jgi:predicted Rossmann fold nucleotide-binding protein DprA/Smf involved in DNA uptake
MGCHRAFQAFSEPVEDDEGLFEEWAEDADAAGEDSDASFGQALAAPEHRRKALLGALSASPIEIDALIRQLGISLAELQGLLFELELEGLLQRHPGNRVSRA